MSRPLRILHVNTIDVGGGAASVAQQLMQAGRDAGHDVRMAVGRKRGDDPGVFVLPDDDRGPYRATGYAAVQVALKRMAGHYPNRGWGLTSRTLRLVTHPGVLASRRRGNEDFAFPGTAGLIRRAGFVPDLIHCHNLHGGYFDLRALTALSARVPTLLTLHDSWLLSGHCAHSFSCDRWQTGCGACPDLSIHPAIRGDRTAENWQSKQHIFARSRLFVATPAAWLMDRVRSSMLAPAVLETRVLPNGVDNDVFHSRDRIAARRSLGLAADDAVILVKSDALHGGTWMDHGATRAALVAIAAEPRQRRLVVIAIGDTGVSGPIAGLTIRFAGHVEAPPQVATYFRAADVYLHAARADTFPGMVLEAMACGTPVVATRVGGIPEQIRSGRPDGPDTGILVAPGDVAGLACGVMQVITNTTLAARLGAAAAADVCARFQAAPRAADYLTWYRTIIARNDSR